MRIINWILRREPEERTGKAVYVVKIEDRTTRQKRTILVWEGERPTLNDNERVLSFRSTRGKDEN